MALRTFAIAVLWLGASLGDTAQEKSTPSFDQLLKQVKKSEPKADFAQLRMAFAQTAAYKPYDNNDKTNEAMNAALEKKDYETALALAEKVLQLRYVDMQAHLVAYRANVELKRNEQANHHKYVFDGLFQSILKSGNGKGPKTAYIVISIDEEVVVLEAMRIRQTKQALVSENDQKFDQIEGVEQKSQQPVRVYFNVTTPFNWLVGQHKKGK